jgi:FkbM family methyltransferase
MTDVNTPTLYTLPNGVAVQQCHRYETDFVYREVFIDHIYTRDFPDLPAAPCVIDVGVNIGLFSLFIRQQFPQARIYGFEPSPELFALASSNLANRNTTLFQQGLGAQSGQQRFTYYPNYSLLSGFHGHAEEDKQLLSAGIVQQLQHKEDADAYLELLIGDKLEQPRHYDCDITTLSAILAQEEIPVVDLLKIDAEKAEVDVLRGIAASNWPKILRIVIEAHSRDSADATETILRDQHYTVRRQINARHQRAEIFTITAQRNS